MIGAVPLLAALALAAPAQAPADHAVVWAVGDGANGSAPAKRVATMIARDKPDRFLYLGDVYPTGTAAAYRTAYDPVYGRLASRTDPTPGNHEWGLRDQGYFPYWRAKLGHKVGSWFTTSAGGWQLLSLNSEAPHGRGSAQLKWLARQLRAPGTCRIAFWHRPRYSAGTVHGDQPDIAPLWNALEGHAVLVLNGHEHDIQRYGPRDRLVEIVSGAGGNGHYALKRGVRGLAFGNATNYGATRVELEPGVAHIKIVATGGKTLDATDVPCTPGA